MQEKKRYRKHSIIKEIKGGSPHESSLISKGSTCDETNSYIGGKQKEPRLKKSVGNSCAKKLKKRKMASGLAWDRLLAGKNLNAKTNTGGVFLSV